MSRKVRLILDPMANLGRAWAAAANLRPDLGSDARRPRPLQIVRMGTFKKTPLAADAPLHIQTGGETCPGFGSNAHRLKFKFLPGALQVVRNWDNRG